MHVFSSFNVIGRTCTHKIYTDTVNAYLSIYPKLLKMRKIRNTNKTCFPLDYSVCILIL